MKWEKDFDEEVERYINMELHWSSDATDWERTLVMGNIRGFATHIKSQLAKFPETVRADAKKEERAEIASKLSEIVHARKPQDFILGDVLRLKEELLRRSRDVTE